jgi:hypothetical protein
VGKRLCPLNQMKPCEDDCVLVEEGGCLLRSFMINVDLVETHFSEVCTEISVVSNALYESHEVFKQALSIACNRLG